MMMEWSEQVREFIVAATTHGVRMLMVGGGAVNWHGYKRHSADVDFWLERTAENLRNLRLAVNTIGYDIDEFPGSVHEGLQNVSLKFSPVDLDVELTTRFSVDRSFEEAYLRSVVVQGRGDKLHFWHVLAYEDLITSKVKSARPKDLLDVYELQRLRGGN